MSLYKKSGSNDVKVGVLQNVTINNVTYNIKEYIDLSGNTIHPFSVETDADFKEKLKLKDTVIIQGNFGNFRGYLFSDFNSSLSNLMTIFVNESSVIWYLGSGDHPYCSIPIERGTHIYGFHEGQPFYDNQILEPSNDSYLLNDNEKESYFYTDKQSDSYFTIGSTSNSNNSYKIYRVIISCSETGKTYSYYPCSDGTTHKIYEALSTESFSEDTFTNSSVGKNVKYGVSIDDIKAITGSKYRDLMAIMAEDSGIELTIANENADPPYILRQNGIDHEFAFSLTDISIPENAIRQSNLSNYKKGELIFGRRPKWNIWANSMPYSIWNKPETDYTGGYDPTKLVYATYNLTEHWNKNGQVKLEWFENYCESDENRPEVKFINPDGTDAKNIEIHYHNGVPCFCGKNQVMPGLCENDHADFWRVLNETLTAENAIYLYSNELPDSSVGMKLGNIINWNTSQKEQYEADKINGDYTMNQLIYGMCATLSHSFLTAVADRNGGYTTELVNIIIGYATEQTKQAQSTISQNNRIGTLPLVALSSDSDTTTIERFKNGRIIEDGQEVGKLMYEKLRATGNEEVRLFNEILASINRNGDHIYKIDAVGSMNLLKRPTEIYETDTPKETDLVYLNKFINSTKLSIKGVFDPSNEITTVEATEIMRMIYNSAIIYLPPGTSDQMTSLPSSQKNTRIIFMNQKNNLGIDPALATSETPVYFFPLGYNYNDQAVGEHYRNYADSVVYNNKKYGGIVIPFLLTIKDFTNYEAIVNNKDNTDPNYYQIIQGSPTDNDKTISSGYTIFVKNTANYNSYDSYIGRKYINDSYSNVHYGANDLIRWDEVNNMSAQYPTYITSHRFKYNTNLNLSVIAEVIYSKDVLDANDKVIDKIIKKDRIRKPAYQIESMLDGDYYKNYYNNGMTQMFNYSNYLELSTNQDYAWFINISTKDCPHVIQRVSGTSEFYDTDPNVYYKIPDDVTVKFWVENSNSSIITFGNGFKTESNHTWFEYSSVNDSWYKPILGSSLYIFIKDLQNNEWKNGPFKLTISHWLYGKKLNAFITTNSSSVPTKLLDSTGDYLNGLDVNSSGQILQSGEPSNWKDYIDLTSGSHIWMSERFFAKLANLPETINFNKYVNLIEQKLFTDKGWSTPIEIKNEEFKPIVFMVYINSEFEQQIVNNIDSYIKYVENDGFYGIIKDDIVYTTVYKIYYNESDDSYEIDQDLYCYNVDTEEIEAGISYNDDAFLNYKSYYIYLNEDLTVDHVEFKQDDHDFFDNFHQSLLNKNYGYNTNNISLIQAATMHLTIDYYYYTSSVTYMFSKNSVNTPDREPDAWITINEFLNTGEHSQDYKFMYVEKVQFDMFGLCYKTFNIIQIVDEGDSDNFYPILNKDIRKLNLLTQYTEYIDPYWYKISNSNIVVNKRKCPYSPKEILAPYKINGLNVSIKDIVQVQITSNVPADLDGVVRFDTQYNSWNTVVDDYATHRSEVETYFNEN